MPTNTYDLIVIGDDFAGLVAATLCAGRGMRVLVAETGGAPASYKLGKHTLPVHPLTFVGSSSPAITRVLDELHFDHALKRRLERPGAFQLVAPNARINVSADELSLGRELTRELPARAGDAAAVCERANEVAALLDPVLSQDVIFPPAGFRERRQVGRAANLTEEADAWHAEIDDDLLRALLELPAALGTRCDPAGLSNETRVRSFASWRQGTGRLQGDWSALREMFLDKLSRHSGEHRIARVGELTFSWGKANGVRLESGEELGAEHIIAATDLSELSRIAERKLPKRLTQLADQIEPAGYRYTLNLMVGEAGIPEGMAPVVLVVNDPSAPLIGDNAFSLHLSQPDDEARVIVSVQAVAPMPGDRRLHDVLADLRVALRERLEMVMPFFSEHVLLAHSPHEPIPAEGVEGVLELAHPIKPAPVWDSSIEAYLGVSAVPYSVGIKHLTVASSQNLIGLGLEGDFAAGWCAARIASGVSGKKRSDFKADVLAAK